MPDPDAGGDEELENILRDGLTEIVQAIEDENLHKRNRIAEALRRGFLQINSQLRRIPRVSHDVDNTPPN